MDKVRSDARDERNSASKTWNTEHEVDRGQVRITLCALARELGLILRAVAIYEDFGSACAFDIYLFIYLFGCLGSQLQHAGSLVVACEIQFPDQGSNPGPLHWEHGISTTGPPGKSPACTFESG